MEFRCFLCRLVSKVDPVEKEQGKPYFDCPHCRTRNKLKRVAPKPDAPDGFAVVGIDLDAGPES